jgi:hypothetical protein
MCQHLVLQKLKTCSWRLAIVLVGLTVMSGMGMSVDQSRLTTSRLRKDVAKINGKSQEKKAFHSGYIFWWFAEPLALAKGAKNRNSKGSPRGKRKNLACADIHWGKMDKVVNGIVSANAKAAGQRMPASGKKSHRLENSSVGRCGPGWEWRNELGDVFTRECCTHDVIIDQLVKKFNYPPEQAHELAKPFLKVAIESYEDAVAAAQSHGDSGDSGDVR